jgi:hypothetical protein
MPTRVVFYVSKNGRKFREAATVMNPVKDNDYTVQILSFAAETKPLEARYVKVVAYNYGKLPAWHAGHAYDGDAFIFIDEIEIQ